MSQEMVERDLWNQAEAANTRSFEGVGRSKSFGNAEMESYVASKQEIKKLNDAMDRGAIAAEEHHATTSKQDNWSHDGSSEGGSETYRDPDWKPPTLMKDDSMVSVLSMGGVSQYYAETREQREQEAAARALEREAKEHAAEKDKRKQELLMGKPSPATTGQLTKEEQEDIERERVCERVRAQHVCSCMCVHFCVGDYFLSNQSLLSSPFSSIVTSA